MNATHRELNKKFIFIATTIVVLLALIFTVLPQYQAAASTDIIKYVAASADDGWAYSGGFDNSSGWFAAGQYSSYQDSLLQVYVCGVTS